MAQRTQFETDAIRPTGLSSTIAAQHRVDDKLNSAEYLDAVEEEWNKRVDAEVETLVGGMQDLVELAVVGEKDKHRMYEEAFETEMRAENMVVERRQKELADIERDMELAKERAAVEWKKLVDGEDVGEVEDNEDQDMDE